MYVCMECEDMLCMGCSNRMHMKGARQNHSLYGIRKAAYSKKLFANNLDRVMMIVQKERDQSLPLSPWFIFYDEAKSSEGEKLMRFMICVFRMKTAFMKQLVLFALYKSPFWYNFQTRERVRANPNNLVDPPETTIRKY